MRALVLLSFVSVLFGCGPQQDELDGVPIARFRSGLTMSGAGGCSTNIAAGLTNQLIEELNCISPNLMVDFTGSHTNLHSDVTHYLAPGASNALRAATTAENDFITISDAYRPVSSQYLLYKWWQQGQCGIQLAAAPGSSNHQSGRAIDTPNYSYWRSALGNAGWTWHGSSDVVHFDFLSSPNVASNSVLAFQRLWNKNNGARLVEDGVWGPNTSSALAQSPTTGFPVHGCAPVTPTTGTLSGAVTDALGGAALAGVTVTVNGQTKTTAANGTFEFTLGAGVFTVSAAKSGYVTNSVSRTVQLGGNVSASLTLTREVTEGTVRGVVVRVGDASPVEGAVVTAGTKRLTTGADGSFSFELPAGEVSVSVSKRTFVAQSQQVSVVAGRTTALRVELVASGEDLPPVLELLSPTSGASSDLSRVMLTGVASDDFSVLTRLEIVVNGDAPTQAQLVGGEFEVSLKLAPGLNTVVLSVTDSQGQTTRLTWTGTFRAGVDGLVHRFDDTFLLAADAELTLYEPDSDTLVGQARSDALGRFELNAAFSGTARLHVEKAGFTVRDLLLRISDEARTSLNVGLTPGDAPGIRVIEPDFDASLEADEVRVSGVVFGLEVTTVTVNGVPATLVGTGFVATLPLARGRTVFDIVAANGVGVSVRREHVVRRPTEGGCAGAPAGALVVVGLLLARRRRFTTR